MGSMLPKTDIERSERTMGGDELHSSKPEVVRHEHVHETTHDAAEKGHVASDQSVVITFYLASLT